MAEEQQQEKKTKPLTFAGNNLTISNEQLLTFTVIGLTALAQALDSKQARTSFGKLPLSVEKSQPVFGFPQAKRDDQEKIFMDELTKTSNAGKMSPGPIYNYTDQIKYEKPPGWQFGTAERIGVDKPRYDFYENAAFLDDPLTADASRKPRCNAPKIGTEPRMQLNTLESTPGPQYLPKDRPEFIKQPQYTFGFRRGGTGALKNQTSTPGSVGPGRYVPEASANPSTKQNFPRWTLPKAGRPSTESKKVDKNQTYDTRSSIGKQPHSKNRSSAVAHFGSSGRENMSKVGTFKDMMQGSASVKLYHPKF